MLMMHFFKAFQEQLSAKSTENEREKQRLLQLIEDLVCQIFFYYDCQKIILQYQELYCII
jgi:hypothetical protein